MAEVRDITAEEMATAIGGEGTALVEFYTEGCPACARFGPTYARLAEEYGDRASLLKMEARKNMAAAKEHSIRGVPTVVVFRGGQELQRLTGAKTLEEMREWLAPVIG